MQRFYTLLLLTCFATIGQAQHLQELSLHFAQKTWQSQYTNPARMNQARVTVGLPVVSSFMAGVANTAFSVRDLARDSVVYDSVSQGYDTVPYFNTDVIAQLNKNDFIGFGTNFDLFSLGIRPTKRLQLGLDVSVNTRLQLFYPSAMIRFLWFGNRTTLGEPQNFAPRFEYTTYAQVAARGAYMLPGDKITVGAAVKYLQGAVNMSSSNKADQLTITTLNETNYPIDLNANYQINFSGPGINQFDSVRHFVDSLRANPVSVAQNGFSGFGNNGFAVDLGTTFKLTDNLTLAASLIDLGYIKWSEGRNLALTGSYHFDGIDVSGLALKTDTLDPKVLIDSLIASFPLTETRNSYKTALATKLYVSAEYRLLKVFRVGGLFFGEQYKGTFNPALGINANVDLKNILSVGVMACYRNRSISNLGMNLAIKGGPLQFYLASDNLFTVFDPLGAKNFNLRMGLNVRVGKVKED